LNKIEFSNQINALIGEFSYLMPEGIIVLGSLLLIVLELVTPAKQSFAKTLLTLITLVLAGLAVNYVQVDGTFLDGALNQNQTVRNVKLLFLVLTGLILLFPASKKLKVKGEYH